MAVAASDTFQVRLINGGVGGTPQNARHASVHDQQNEFATTPPLLYAAQLFVCNAMTDTGVSTTSVTLLPALPNTE